MNEYICTYNENGSSDELYIYFYADDEAHAEEQFYDLFKGNLENIELLHCGELIG